MGEVVVDETNSEIRVGNGVTPGGVSAVAGAEAVIAQIASADGASRVGVGGGRTLAQKLGDTVSVKDAPFNAKGDGVTNDAPAFQAAIDYLASIGGGTVEVPKGTYLLNRNGTVTDMYGASAVCVKLNAPNITLRGAGKLLKGTNANAVLLHISAANVTVRDIGIDGGSQSTAYFVNDEVRIVSTASNTLVDNITIWKSSGGGVAVLGSPDAIVRNSKIFNVRDNSVLVAEPGADRCQVLDNRLIGTLAQNNVYVTASSGSADVPGKVYDTLVRGNFCRGSGDTCIELGMGSSRYTVDGNNLAGSANPPILLRDSQFGVVSNNQIDPTGCTDAIAVLRLHKPNSFPYHVTISGNVVSGIPNRSGVYIGGSNIVLDNNQFLLRPENYAWATGLPAGPDAGKVSSDFAATAFCLEGGGDVIQDVSITNNKVLGYAGGVAFNYGDIPATLKKRIVVRGNTFKRVAKAIGAYVAVLDRGCIIENNDFIDVTYRVFELVGATLTPTAAQKDAWPRISGNRIYQVAYPDVQPSIWEGYSPQDAVVDSAAIQVMQVPESQYDFAGIGTRAALKSARLTIRFPDGQTWASYQLNPYASVDADKVKLLGGSADMFAGSDGFAGWALVVSGEGVGLQRRGASTGNAYRAFYYTITN
jgi:hypothetical protein